jgi:aspartyl-tRNA synthetase
MFEWDKEEHRWQALHHPFTSPKDGQVLTIENAGNIKAKRTT